MPRSHERTVLGCVLLGFAVAAISVSGPSYAAFSSTTSNGSDSFVAAPDWTAPSATSVIAKTTGYSTGFIKQGGTYYVYANITDTGNPASGVQTATANVSNITTGQTSVTLTSGTYSAGGTSYNYRSGSLTANNPLTAGSKSYTVTSTDAAGNSQNQSFSVTVDNTAPSASDVQTSNASGGVVGKAEAGDTITITYSEPIDPESILSGWNGTSQILYVSLANGGGANDTITFVSTVSPFPQLPMGSINLGRTDYTSGNVTFGVGTSSTMVMSGNSIVVTLGTPNAADTTAAANGTMQWTPSSTATDRAGNACSATARNETGTADKEF